MLEQDLSAAEKLAVIQEIRDTLDLVGEAERLLLSPVDEGNPLIVDTLSTSLADPFDPEPKTQIKEKK